MQISSNTARVSSSDETSPKATIRGVDKSLDLVEREGEGHFMKMVNSTPAISKQATIAAANARYAAQRLDVEGRHGEKCVNETSPKATIRGVDKSLDLMEREGESHFVKMANPTSAISKQATIAAANAKLTAEKAQRAAEAQGDSNNTNLDSRDAVF